MQTTTLVLVLFALAVSAYYLGRSRAIDLVGGPGSTRSLHSLPRYYGYYLAFACLVPGLAALFAWLLVEPKIIIAMLTAELPPAARELDGGQLNLLVNSVRNLAAGATLTRDPLLEAAAARYLELEQQGRIVASVLALGAAVVCLILARRRIAVDFRARNAVEKLIELLLISASSIALLTTLGIVLSVVFEAVLFFQKVSVVEFLFGLDWSPQTAIRSDQVGSSGSFGIVPLLTGTLLITFIAVCIAVPVGLMSAIYMTEYATSRLRDVAKPTLEILAGIPTVVYGFFAALTVAPWVRRAGEGIGLDVASESALAAGLVMGIMIIPLVSSLSDDAIRAVPKSMREGALALGSTRAEMIRGVVLPAAAPGIAGGVLLAVSRAIGETMIVVMAAGLAANLTANPFAAVTTVTVQIVTLLIGDQEFDSAKTLAAFALGLVLFLLTMLLNIAGLRFVRRFRERYE